MKKTPAEIEAEKKAAKELLDGKVAELKALKIEKPEDVTKAFNLHKEISELKGLNVDEKLAEIEAATAELKAAKPEVTAEELKAISDKLDITIRAFDIMQTRVKDTKIPATESKSFDDVLSKAIEEKTDEFAKMARGEKGTKSVSVELDIKAVGAVSTANVTGGSVWGAQYRPGIIMDPMRKTHMRQILQTGNVGAGTDYYFMRENGAGEGSIAATSETTAAAAATTQATGLKPQFDQDLIEASVKIETIAGWMLVSRKAMSNIPGFTGYLQRRLPERLLRAEDGYALYGTGTTPEWKGILTAGNFTDSTSGATVLVEKIIDDLSLLEDTYERNANGIVMRPADYYTFFKNKATGSGEYDLPQGVTFVNGVLYILGVPVSTTTALTAGDYIVGDFSGAEMLMQEGMRIEFFEQDGTNVRTNQITVRIEETGCLPVYGANYFIKGAA